MKLHGIVENSIAVICRVKLVELTPFTTTTSRLRFSSRNRECLMG